MYGRMVQPDLSCFTQLFGDPPRTRLAPKLGTLGWSGREARSHVETIDPRQTERLSGGKRLVMVAKRLVVVAGPLCDHALKSHGTALRFNARSVTRFEPGSRRRTRYWALCPAESTLR
jgi:hypothetical protein